MAATTPIIVDNLTKLQVLEWLDSFDVIFTDCDGALWHDQQIIPGVVETVNRLKNLGKQIYLVTNNGTKTRWELWQKAKAMEFDIEESQIIAPTHTIAEYLKTHLAKGEKVYVVASEAMSSELNSLNIENFGVGPDPVQGKWTHTIEEIAKETKFDNIKAVVVGFDDQLSFYKLMRAANILDQSSECIFLATNSDAVHKFSTFCLPGTGAILKAIESCVGREACIMGKPNPLICENLINSGKVIPRRTLMIGDCYKNDVVFGKRCNFHTLLVGTGRYNWSDVEELVKSNTAEYIPDYYIASLGNLQAYL